MIGIAKWNEALAQQVIEEWMDELSQWTDADAFVKQVEEEGLPNFIGGCLLQAFEWKFEDELDSRHLEELMLKIEAAIEV